MTEDQLSQNLRASKAFREWFKQYDNQPDLPMRADVWMAAIEWLRKDMEEHQSPTVETILKARSDQKQWHSIAVHGPSTGGANTEILHKREPIEL